MMNKVPTWEALQQRFKCYLGWCPLHQKNGRFKCNTGWCPPFVKTIRNVLGMFSWNVPSFKMFGICKTCIRSFNIGLVQIWR